MKKFLIFVIFILAILLTGCIPDGTVRLPNLTGLTQQEITQRLNRLKMDYKFRIPPQIYQDDSEFDCFIEYGGGLKAGDIVDKSTFLYIYTTALPLTVDRLAEVQMPEYENESFISTGIGPVTLAQPVDGDTAHFYDLTGEYIKVRFLGIDTPEWTREHEPWGGAAATYTKNFLLNAQTILLESEGNARFDAYGRYLAWVWVDGILLNLAIVQEAYSGASVKANSKYFEIFFEVEQAVSKTGRRIWGEIDPNYRYS